MIQLFELPPDIDLGPFAAFLWRQRIRHRITHLQGQQQLWLADPADADYVMEQFNRWQRGEVLEESANQTSKRTSIPWWRLPITLVLIGFSLALTLLTGFGSQYELLRWFSFVNFELQGQSYIPQSFSTLIRVGEWWRFVTPIFIHFSLLHLVFNLLWTWELGRRIELTRGSILLLWLTLFIGVISNAAQFLMTGPLFGGLSGVIFGLMGYTWLSDRLRLGPGFGMPPALMTFMLIWLVLGVSGVIEKLGFGAIANTAHLVGLLAGLVCVLPVWLRRNRP
ncbi:rhomboid family intramembrane serine protease [Motiliproteus sp.]|uniref:rhomboid family intramembrane serine protease n=1 Tax=Motiliproteus sp. TaxID=1898955 RepID=UPI003BAAADC5